MDTSRCPETWNTLPPSFLITPGRPFNSVDFSFSFCTFEITETKTILLSFWFVSIQIVDIFLWKRQNLSCKWASLHSQLSELKYSQSTLTELDLSSRWKISPTTQKETVARPEGLYFVTSITWEVLSQGGMERTRSGWMGRTGAFRTCVSGEKTCAQHPPPNAQMRPGSVLSRCWAKHVCVNTFTPPATRWGRCDVMDTNMGSKTLSPKMQIHTQHSCTWSVWEWTQAAHAPLPLVGKE